MPPLSRAGEGSFPSRPGETVQDSSSQEFVRCQEFRSIFRIAPKSLLKARPASVASVPKQQDIVSGVQDGSNQGGDIGQACRT